MSDPTFLPRHRPMRWLLPLLLLAALAISGCKRAPADAPVAATTPPPAAVATDPEPRTATATATAVPDDDDDRRCRERDPQRAPAPDDDDRLPPCPGHDVRRAVPQAWHAEGGLDDFYGTGTICDLSKPFTISGSGNTMSFTPTGDNAGTYTYKGVMGGFGVHGDGTWSAKVDAIGGTLTGTGNGCVDTPLGTQCADDTERYTLTPAPPCGS